jgi:hypothetical protein
MAGPQAEPREVYGMIHIISVHYEDSRWIQIQRRYIDRHIPQPFRMYSFFTNIPGDYRRSFDYCREVVSKDHADKLNILADIAIQGGAAPDDLLIFMDGDAFPIGDVLPFCRQRLAETPLIAVQRLENLGSPQPHPSFCLTTVGFWQQIQGDWTRGFKWTMTSGEKVTDVGGNLLHILDTGGYRWLPLLRSNHVNLHPLYFGVYAGLIYHHGAGFRQPFSTVDIESLSPLWRWYDLHRRDLPRPFNRWTGHQKAVMHRNQQLSDMVFDQILTDEYFYEQFLQR